jgi:preprotein translocase subunit YajC
MWILAQTDPESQSDVITSEPVGDEAQSMTKDTAGDVNQPVGTRQQKPGLDMMSVILIGVMVFFVFMMFRGPRKKQQEHRKMVQSLQKNDRVRTIGGIHGTIVDVRDDEIVLKIDESNNTKIKVSPSAIGTKLSQEKS